MNPASTTTILGVGSLGAIGEFLGLPGSGLFIGFAVCAWIWHQQCKTCREIQKDK